MKTLYSKDSKGELRVWSIYTEGARMMSYEDDPLDYHILCKQYGVKI